MTNRSKQTELKKMQSDKNKEIHEKQGENKLK